MQVLQSRLECAGRQPGQVDQSDQVDQVDAALVLEVLVAAADSTQVGSRLGWCTHILAISGLSVFSHVTVNALLNQA